MKKLSVRFVINRYEGVFAMSLPYKKEDYNVSEKKVNGEKMISGDYGLERPPSMSIECA